MFGLTIVKTKDFPFFEKAHRLARGLTEDQIDDILKHRAHVHKNPAKRNDQNYEKAGE